MLAARSLSARRAWIEISVSLNRFGNNLRSLSARRAWIEIKTGKTHRIYLPVALRKESVDRNTFAVHAVRL